MTPLQFVDKWRPVVLTERAAAQEHFIDLCRLFDHPTPIEDDPVGERFTFEKGVQRSGGGDGFADVWKRGHFAWEYKKRRRNLDEALGQLSRYALALESPPLHVVCDTERFRIVTAYTNCAPKAYELSLEDVLDSQKRGWLEATFYDPTRLRPGANRADITKVAADKFSSLTHRLHSKGHSLEDVGHFVNRLVFLFFAEDVQLLETNYFRKAIDAIERRPTQAKSLLTDLFRTFKTGGRFGLDHLPWINGGLFDDREALDLDEHEIGLIKAAGSQDWAHIDPTIFGTLFERFIDPRKRAQIGAHYTDAEKIKKIIDPVILAPLKREWISTRSDIQELVKKAKARGNSSKFWQQAEERRSQYLERLRNLAILDPACGSGNFLYLALHGVKNQEHAANQECEAMGLPPRMPLVGPEILRGIEINPLAAELARTTVWIGDIQWRVQNGIRSIPEPILRTINSIECRDALVNEDGSAAVWPQADMIIGNPPYLGAKLMKRNLGREATRAIRNLYAGRLPAFTDLVCYFFENARVMLEEGSAQYVGFVATNSIRKNTNLPVMRRITHTAQIFDAHSEEKWTVEGATVDVSLICFGKDDHAPKTLNGVVVEHINSDLTTGIDLTKAKPLFENRNCAFLGVQKSGPFDVPGHQARAWMREPANPNGTKNSTVLKPYWNGDDLAGRPRDVWFIDLPPRLNEDEAALFASPFKHIAETLDECGRTVKEQRAESDSTGETYPWWQPWRPRPEMRARIKEIKRYIVTAETSQHRVFSWLAYPVLPDKNLIVIPREDDLMFGLLQNRFHAAWSLRKGSDLQDRPRYTHSSTFATFPFPEGMSPNVPINEARAHTAASAIEVAARHLHTLRENWLFPSDLITMMPEADLRLPARRVAIDAAARKVLSSRTMTALYNEFPIWLQNAHRALDIAVAHAYDWPYDISDKDALGRLLELNQQRLPLQPRAMPTPSNIL